MGTKYRVLALISGGKDSCYSMIQCVAAGHEIVALANLSPENKNVHELDSYMYQTVGHSAISLYAEAMGGLPLFCGSISGSSIATKSNNYTPTDGDEVEDLYKILMTAQSQVYFDAICTGAILSDYQRIRVENVCSRLGLVSLAYLWRRDQAELLDEMLDFGKVEAIIVKVATLGLEKKHLGMNLRSIKDHLHKMNKEYGINICGEGGEYETFTLDCPLFFKSIVVDDFEVVIHSDDAFAQVAYIKFKKLSLREKGIPLGTSYLELFSRSGASLRDPMFFAAKNSFDDTQKLDDPPTSEKKPSGLTVDEWLNVVNQKEIEFNFDESSGDFYVNNLISLETDPRDATKEVFAKLRECLSKHNIDLSKVSAVTLLVGDMSQYAQVNSEYIKFFNINPPVRVCVQADIQFPLILSAFGHQDGKAMHVQSISHWAPANIGPYSQAFESSDLLYVAGQIGLVPGSMSLISGLESQAELSLRHLRRILEVYNLTTHDIIWAVCFVTVRKNSLPTQIWKKEAKNGVLPHLIVVEVSRLPRDALIEWQVVGTTGMSHTVSETVSLEGGYQIHTSKSNYGKKNLKCFAGDLRSPDQLSPETLTNLWSSYSSSAFLGMNGNLTVYFKPGTISFKGPVPPNMHVPVIDFSNDNVVLAWTFVES